MGLAGEKRRQRIAFDPNNQQWTLNKQGNYGAKIMNKMGWKHGHGLGRSLDGKTGIVKAKVKKNTRGIGGDSLDGLDDGWIDTKKDYEALLARLSRRVDKAKTEEEEELATHQVDEKNKEKQSSLISRGKYRKNKSVKGYDAKAVAEILGVRVTDVSCETHALHDIGNPQQELPTQSPAFVVSNVSVRDYFRRRLRKVKGLQGIALTGLDGSVWASSSSEDEQQVKLKKKKKRKD